ncbi:MAG: insulinase family protein [Bacteroidales bacterium]|jgi:zinc protease|nr:insulinase family protein [Bacteroidales bacterium]
MKKQLFILFLFLFATAGVSFAQFGNTGSKKEKKSDLSAKVPIDKKVRMGKLDNGITYYIRANKKPEGRVQFRLAVNAGSVMEDDDQQGLAHFCEHMAFNGTEYYPHNELISKLQAKGVQFGGHVNAWTSFDETVYYVNMPNDDEMLEMGMKILDGWASKLLMDPKEIEAERGVIREEWRGRLGAQDRLQKQYWPIMLQGSRYADRIPIGLESVIMNFQRPVIMRFYQDWYRPDLQAVIIVGDVDVDQMEAKVKEYFNDNQMPANPKARPDYDVPGNKEPLVAIATDKEASSAGIQMMWKHAKAPQGTIGDYRQMLVRNLATNMINARFEEMAEKATAPFLYAGGGYGGFIGKHTDAFFLSAYPKDNRIEDATALLLKEMKRVDEHGFVQTELDRAKETMLEGYRKSAKELNKTQSNSFAQEYTNHFLDGEVIPGIRQEDSYAREFVPEITLDEVNAVVKDWITDENFIYILTAPEKDGYKIPTKAEVLKIVANSKNETTEPWVDNYKEEELFTKKVEEVLPAVVRTNDVLGYTEYVLPNGVSFVVKKTNYKEDEIQMRSFSDGGTSLYSDNEAFIASQAADFIDEAGIANFSNSQLGKKLQGKSVRISPVIGGTTQGFSGSCSPKDLETMLQLLNLYYDAPRKDKEAFDRNIEALRTQSRMAEANPQIKFMKDYYGKAYNNNPRLILVPSESDIDGLNLDRIYEIFKERFNDASMQKFIFVGNISDENIQTISNYLNLLPSTGKQRNEKRIDRTPVLVEGVNHSLTLAGTDKQGMVLIQGETRGFNGSLRDRVAVDALGEALQIRTTEVIREKMGETYSPYATASYDISFDGSVSWMFYLQCAPENCESVEAAAIDLIRECIKKGCDKETLKKVKLQMIKERETSMQENGFWMNMIYGKYVNHENRDALVANYEDLVNSLTVADLKRIAKTYFDLKHYMVGTLKPEN